MEKWRLKLTSAKVENEAELGKNHRLQGIPKKHTLYTLIIFSKTKY